MRRLINYFLFAFFIFILHQTAVLYFSGSNIPDLKYKNFNTNSFSKTKLPSKKTLFIFFTTECGSCDDAATAVYNFSKNNSNYNFVFITEEKDRNLVTNYVERNRIKKFTNYIFINQNRSFQKDFGLGFAMSIPTILYYDQNGKFVKEIQNLEELSKHL